MAENIRFLLSIEAVVDDPVGFRAGQLSMTLNLDTGQEEPAGPLGFDIEEQVGTVAMQAALLALRDASGVTPIAGQVLPWKKAEDGSFPAKTLPQMSSRAELEERSQRRWEDNEGQE
ncbi:hypothetical protein [Verrucosispora sp. NA02020]|uniref:hypothetical protein n=1 Tax=Verrucosispora sp. NA02020 TaxID=2742132 RepID=UPI003D757B3F